MSRKTGAERDAAKMTRATTVTWSCRWPGCTTGRRLPYDPTTWAADVRRHHEQAGHADQPNRRLDTPTTEQRTTA
jgi:hypothetical protein